MVFKSNWEKASTHYSLQAGTIEKMVKLAYPNKTLLAYEQLSGGCANINTKIYVKNEQNPLILRIYLRDQDACYREKKLGHLLREEIPIPQTYYIGEIDSYCFAITEYMQGISLRELLLGPIEHNVGSIMRKVGNMLAKITSHEFIKSGFFNKDLDVFESENDFVLRFLKDCLNDLHVSSILSAQIISKISLCLDKYVYVFQDLNDHNLVHGDFDPSNILVDQIEGSWEVTGVLDWEFSFAGSVLWDVANMLRYAHHMQPTFQDAFLDGLINGGIHLPKDWHIKVQLLNLLSLLDILRRSNLKNSPSQCADIHELVIHILNKLEKPF
jgi:Ser/Thr protein kinase RdoA (MazF antagonist)